MQRNGGLVKMIVYVCAKLLTTPTCNNNHFTIHIIVKCYKGDDKSCAELSVYFVFETNRLLNAIAYSKRL